MAALNAFAMAVAFSLASSIAPMVPDMVLCMVSIMVRMLSMIAIICGNGMRICGKQHIQLVEVLDQCFHFDGDLIDPVECVKYRSQ